MNRTRIPQGRAASLARTSAVVVASLALLAGAGIPAATAGQDTTSRTQDLSSVTDGQENGQVKQLLPEQDVLHAPRLGTAPPKSGQGSPGATMGQGSKSAAQTAHLSAPSAQEAKDQVEQAKKGQTPQAVKDAQQYQRTGAAARGVKSEAAEDGAVHGAAAAWAPSGIQGMDVSGWQPVVDWNAEYAAGARFTYIKATEGTGYSSSAFSGQYIGATNAGMYRGAYHFALPGQSSGAEQARYFLAHGGGWSADGQTLPGLLDIEYNPYSSLGNTCYNLSSGQMVSWIKDFVNTYKSLTGRYPAVYSNNNWWRTCTGNSTEFAQMGLDVANYNTNPGTMPGGWNTFDIWQYSAEGTFAGDSNVFGGNASKLLDFAVNPNYKPIGGTTPGSYYTAANGIQINLRSGIGAFWNRNRSLYGEPLTGEVGGLPDGGVYQRFSNGYTIYWTPFTGAHSVMFTGGIGANYRIHQYERGLGYPVDEETSVDNGVWEQTFRKANGQRNVIVWSRGAGGYVVNLNGAIGAAWEKAGRSKGWGYPTSTEITTGNPSQQTFSKGVTATWTAKGGLQVKKK